MRFVALFTIITGLAVLASAVLGSRAQRMRESYSLENSGRAAASDPRDHCRGIFVFRRYRRRRGRAPRRRRDLGLGYLFFRHTGGDFVRSGGRRFFLVTAATVLAGAIGCWGIFRRSPLEALRAEA